MNLQLEAQEDVLAHLKQRLAHCRETFETANQIITLSAKIETLKSNHDDLKNLDSDNLQDHLTMLANKQRDIERLEWRDRNASCENKLTLPFGKHKDHCVEAVWEHDPGYIVWLAGFRPALNGSRPETHSNNANFPSNVKQLAKSLIRGTCYSCHDELDTDEAWKTFCSSCYKELKMK